MLDLRQYLSYNICILYEVYIFLGQVHPFPRGYYVKLQSLKSRLLSQRAGMSALFISSGFVYKIKEGMEVEWKVKEFCRACGQ